MERCWLAPHALPCLALLVAVVLPTAGANVFDILRRDVLVLTTAAVRGLEARLA